MTDVTAPNLVSNRPHPVRRRFSGTAHPLTAAVESQLTEGGISRNDGRIIVISPRPSMIAAGLESNGWSVSEHIMRADDDGTWLMTDRPESGGFSACVLDDVLTPTARPADMLAHAYAALRPGGRLIIAAPESERSSRTPAGRRSGRPAWFPGENLAALLFREGFERPRFHPRGMEVIAAAAYRSDLPPPYRRPQRLSVIMPVFNERKTFRKAMDALLGKTIPGMEINFIIVESNSTDGTREDVLDYSDHPRVQLILEDRPQGKGHAVRTGLGEAKGDFVIIQDADLEYDIDDYDSLLEPLRQIRGRLRPRNTHESGWFLGHAPVRRTQRRQSDHEPRSSVLLNALQHRLRTAPT